MSEGDVKKTSESGFLTFSEKMVPYNFILLGSLLQQYSKCEFFFQKLSIFVVRTLRPKMRGKNDRVSRPVFIRHSAKPHYKTNKRVDQNKYKNMHGNPATPVSASFIRHATVSKDI